jgi:hypothetical protein
MNRAAHAQEGRGQPRQSDNREALLSRASPKISSAQCGLRHLAEQAVDIDV